MLEEEVQSNFRERFDTILQSGDRDRLCEFLDDQNISDVAELIY